MVSYAGLPPPGIRGAEYLRGLRLCATGAGSQNLLYQTVELVRTTIEVVGEPDR